jgi:hypothetical protein
VCDNWRSIGELAGNVIERLGISGTGTGAAMNAPQPGPRDERGVPSRLEFDSDRRPSSLEARYSSRSLMAGQSRQWNERAGSAKPPAVEGGDGCGQEENAAPNHHAPLGATSRDRRTVSSTAPMHRGQASAVRRSLVVWLRSRRLCILPGSSTRRLRSDSVNNRRLLIGDPHLPRSLCLIRSTTQPSAISASVPRNTAH